MSKLELFLLLLTLIGGLASIILAVVVFESRPGTMGRALRKWRYAFSKRGQINAANAAAEHEKSLASAAKSQASLAKKKMEESQHATEIQIARMGAYIIAEQSSEHIKAIRANNYHAKEKKVLRSITLAQENGYSLPKDHRSQLTRMLKQAHEDAIRAEREREKQAEIKAQIREEEKRQKEINRAIKDAQKEEKLKRRALEEAIRLLGGTHSAEVEKLKAELAEAEAKMERTVSMAQQTRAGHIYVISNIGSFGRDVFKVGMTRRLEPLDRVRELGDASVPFTFDVHAMISSDDAPALEAQLHRELEKHRVNKVNLRKEFFRVEIDQIIDAVRKHHGEVSYEADPEALEYLESVDSEDDVSVEELLG